MLGLLTEPDGRVAALASKLSELGWVGVQLFFVLSGFLITGILLDTQRSRTYFTSFVARRGLRVFPLYYAVLFAAFVVVPLVMSEPPASIEHDRAHQIWLWTYLSNWISGPAASRALPHCWSLAVEEQFYLLWPLVIRQLPPRRCLTLCVALAVAALVIRSALHVRGVPQQEIYTYSVTRMDALTLGGAAACVVRIPGLAERAIAARGKLWAASLAVLVVGALASHLYALETAAGSTIGYSFLAIAFSLFVLASACADAAKDVGLVRVLRAPPLRALGKYSYAVYLFHKPLHDFVGKPFLARSGIDASHSLAISTAYFACALGAAFSAAVASYYLFERRFLALKDRFQPS
jgi:peptidoglycan/LPS O-acetylase OafA/YrhL